MWSDLSWLVDVSFNNGLWFYKLKVFFRLEVNGDVNMPQTGRGEQEPCVE